MYQIDYQYMTKVSMLKVLRCFYTWLWKHSFHIQSINLTNKIIIKTSQKLQTICFSYLTIVSCGTMEWIVGSGSMENPCGGTVWGTTLPSMVNWITEALKGRTVLDVTQMEKFDCRWSEKIQLTDSILSAASDMVNDASTPALRWKPTRVRLVPPDTGPFIGWKSVSKGCCSTNMTVYQLLDEKAKMRLSTAWDERESEWEFIRVYYIDYYTEYNRK